MAYNEKTARRIREALSHIKKLEEKTMFSSALGGIKLQVKDEDVPAAVALMHQSGYRTVFDAPVMAPSKEQHILIRFLKFLAVAVIVLSWLYFVDVKGKM